MPSQKKKTSTAEVSSTEVPSTEVVAVTEKVPVEGVRVTYVVNGNLHHNKAYYEKGQVITHGDEYFDVLQGMNFLTKKDNEWI